ncbi:MBL fold metallo-hydrolase [bacterium]|nr:MBL fold metallo-hydrolase [bacterium]
MALEVIFYGTRGSISAPHPDILKYGAHTPCVVIVSGDRSLIIDAGFGIGFYSDHLANKMGEFHILISHFHWDHIQGLNYFGPVHHPKSTNHFYSPFKTEQMQDVMDIYFDGSYGPFNGWEALNSQFAFHRLSHQAVINGFNVSFKALNHTDPCYAYKISDGKHTVVYASDHEAIDNQINRDFIEWAEGCDMLIHDAMYYDNEYETRTGWGHSTFDMACNNARKIKTRTTLLTHHEPLRSDVELDAIERELRQKYPALNVLCAQQEIVYKP